MGRASKYLTGYVLFLVSSALLLLVAAASVPHDVPGLPPSDAALGIVFIVLIAVAGHFSLRVSNKTKVVVDTGLIFGALLLFPSPWGPLIAAMGVLVRLVVTWRPLLDVLVNTSIVVLECFAAQAAYIVLGGTIPPLFSDMSVLLPLSGAGLVMLLIDRLLISGVAIMYQGGSLRQLLFSRWGRVLKEDVVLLLLGVLAALVVTVQPWALLLTVIPVGLVYISLRNSLRLQVLTRDAVESMADLIDRRDPYTAGHSVRVARLAERLAIEMKLPWDEVETVRAAARVHDLGKIEIDANVLSKPGRLTEEEWARMRRHPIAGAEIVSRFPEFARGAEYVRSHHERWDGRGYPFGLRGEEIPLGARVIAVADAFDAMTSDRPYRKALTLDVVVEEFRRGAGVQWDEQVVEALLRALDNDRLQREEVGVPQPAGV